MPQPFILASGSEIRHKLLDQAAVQHQIAKPRVDEDMIKAALLAEDATPRDIADALAEVKATKISEKNPGALVLGCDQVLDHRGTLLSKPETPPWGRNRFPLFLSRELSPRFWPNQYVNMLFL